MGIESVLTNQNLIPYWMYDLRFRMHIFNILQLACLYYALRYLSEDVNLHPEKYKGEDKDILPPNLL